MLDLGILPGIRDHFLPPGHGYVLPDCSSQEHQLHSPSRRHPYPIRSSWCQGLVQSRYEGMGQEEQRQHLDRCHPVTLGLTVGFRKGCHLKLSRLLRAPSMCTPPPLIGSHHPRSLCRTLAAADFWGAHGAGACTLVEGDFDMMGLLGRFYFSQLCCRSAT